jgi:CheY-like chemotaxis protein
LKKILYVEDSVTAQLLMRRYLHGLCELVITDSPARARQLWLNTGCDLVIADYLFPSGDCMDLLVEMRRVRPALEMPIIVVSSSMDGALQSKLLAVGVNECLSKPLKKDEFCPLLMKMLAEPYVKKMAQSVVGVCCFRWSAGGAFYEYCPELRLELTGNDGGEISKLMQNAIQERLAQGADLGRTTRERTTTYLVQKG